MTPDGPAKASSDGSVRTHYDGARSNAYGPFLTDVQQVAGRLGEGYDRAARGWRLRQPYERYFRVLSSRNGNRRALTYS